MKIMPDISSEKSLRRGLLTVTLLFSFFSFSGYTGNVPHHEQQVFSTELVVKTVAKRTIPFSGMFKKFPARDISSIFSKPIINNALRVYNTLSKTRFDATSVHLFTFDPTERFFRIRKTSSGMEEDLLLLFRG
jgi:hypothetical protein